MTLSRRQKIKLRSNLCSTKYCRNKRGKQRKVCYKCMKKAYTKRHPEKQAYFDLRQNARRRGKEFTLTFDEFMEFAVKTEYVAKKGRNRNSLSIDRKDNSKGYHIDNIRVLTISENSKKSNHESADLPF